MAPIVLEPVRAWLAAQLSVPGKSIQNNTVDVCPPEVKVNEGYGDTGQLCQSAIATVSVTLLPTNWIRNVSAIAFRTIIAGERQARTPAICLMSFVIRQSIKSGERL